MKFVRTLSAALLSLSTVLAFGQFGVSRLPSSHINVIKILGGDNTGYQLNSPWPKYRHDNSGSSVSPWGGCNGTLRWKVYLGSAVFTSSPAIAADGTTYIGAENGLLYAISSAGKIKWTYPTNGPIWSSPAIGTDGTVYVGSEDDSLYAISAAGVKVWSYKTGDQVVSSPSIDSNGNIYFGSWDQNVYSVSKSGKFNWKYLTGGAVQSSPVIDGTGNVYIGSYDNNLYSLSPAGSLNWKFLTKGPIMSSPSIATNGTIYIGSTSAAGDFYAVTSAGQEVWEFDTDSIGFDYGGPITGSPGIGLNGEIYLPAESTLAGLSSIGDFNFSSSSTSYSSPAIASDNSIASTYDNGIQLNYGGNDYQTYRFAQSIILSSPAIGVDGTVYIGSTDGYYYAFGSQVNTIPISSLTISPNPVTGSNPTTGTVTISSAAPSGGDVVNLSSSNPSVASIVTPTAVQSGSTTGTFTITTYAVQSNTSVTIFATSGGVTTSSTLVVAPPQPLSLAVSPTSVQGSSTTTVNGLVTLNGVAPPGGVTVSLSSSNSAVAGVPATVIIPPGLNYGKFVVSHSTVSAQTTVTLTATLNGGSATTKLTVTP